MIDVDNEASQKVAERVGYRREGVRRSAHFKDGLRADMAIYSLLAGDLALGDRRSAATSSPPPRVGMPARLPTEAERYPGATRVSVTLPCRFCSELSSASGGG